MNKTNSEHFISTPVIRTVLAAALILNYVGIAQAASKDLPTSHLIQVKTGITLNYVVQGDPQGPVIVLLHGGGDSWHSYDRVLPLLPEKYRVYAITLRGHGLSDHPETGYARADFAADILDFLDQLQIHHATLVGHSLGSFVAQRVAELDTSHLDRLVLIGSGRGAPKSNESDDLLKEFASLKDPISYTFARDFQASTIYHPVPALFFETLVAEAQRVPAATWHGLARDVAIEESLDNLKRIKVPTLVFWGEKDGIFKLTDENRLIDAIPHATLKDYPETGHALHWERPEEFTKDLLEFIEKK